MERPLAWAALILLLAGVGWHMVTREYTPGALTTHMTAYGENYGRSWDGFGFGRSLGVPLVLTVGETALEREPYTHFPAMGWWPQYLSRHLIGRSTLSHRLPGILFSLLGILMLAMIVGRKSHPGYAVLFAVLTILVPTVSAYASLSGVEPVAMFSVAAFLILWMSAWDRGIERSRWWLYGAFFLGGLITWQFYFVAPGLLLAELLTGRRAASMGVVWRLFPVGVLAFLVVMAHLVIGAGSLEHVWQDMVHTIRNASSDGIGMGGDVGERGRFLTRLPMMMQRNWGMLIAPLALGGMMMSLLSKKMRSDSVTYVAWVLTVVGALNVLLFNGRSSTHDYYYLMMGPALGLWLVQLVRVLAGWIRIPVLMPYLIPLLLVLGAAGWDAKQGWERKESMERSGLQELARTVDLTVQPDQWICCFDQQLQATILYSERFWVSPKIDASYLEKILEDRDEGKHPFRELLVIVDPLTREQAPEFVADLDALKDRRPTGKVLPWDGRVIYVL